MFCLVTLLCHTPPFLSICLDLVKVVPKWKPLVLKHYTDYHIIFKHLKICIYHFKWKFKSARLEITKWLNEIFLFLVFFSHYLQGDCQLFKILFQGGWNFWKSSRGTEFSPGAICNFFFVTPNPLQNKQIWVTTKFKLKNYVNIN